MANTPLTTPVTTSQNAGPLSALGADGAEAEAPMMIPGPQGPPGIGIMGPPGIDADPVDEPMMIPMMAL
jgi:hypothetical protein